MNERTRPVALPGLPPADLRPRRRKAVEARKPAQLAKPAVAPEPPPGVQAPTAAALEDTSTPPDDLKLLFRDIWDLTSDLATLEARLAVANKKQQELLAKAYDMVGGALMQTEDGRTFRIRPVGGARTFVFIWEHTPAKIIKV